jgi:hypothetical protein
MIDRDELYRRHSKAFERLHMSEKQDDLVERVAEEMWQTESVRAVGTRRTVPWSEAGEAAHMQWRPIAKAAIALALEEAATLAEKMLNNYDTMDEIPDAIRGMVR